MLEPDERAILERIVAALERLAPPPVQRERKAATLGTAAYTEDERQRLRLREDLKRQAQKQA